uniref:Delta(24(24(1)))-sterol reductase n=1 Tax=Zooxanthella nutricula TaxID=1333877 RepID=A0A7S2PXU8_9DINO
MVQPAQGKPARSATPPPSKKKTDEQPAADGVIKKPAAKEHEEEVEFGGPIGCAFIMVTSHVLMFGMAASLYGSDWKTFMPTPMSVGWFLSYHFSQYVLARIMPGVFVKGQAEIGYLCNAYSTWYATLAGAGLLHYTGVFDLTTLVTQYPAFLTTAILLGDLYSVIIHLYYARGRQIISIYDFFIGIGLHPRIGMVDIKMVAETRLSWTLLFLCTLGGYIETYRRVGTWMNPTLFMVIAHGLYGNACAKGEHFIPYTWDMTTEKFGWMLCWWNLAGVPLLYCYQSLFLAHNTWSGLTLPPVPAAAYYAVITVLLIAAYCIWDEANYHKCYFKMEQRGEVLERNLFPTFRHVKNAKYIKCDKGKLLIDGWYGCARKIHYTADACMAMLWGLSCGFSSPLPYVYFGFFFAMITHRASRDEARCRQKYGEYWDKYLKAVPYRFIPGVW